MLMRASLFICCLLFLSSCQHPLVQKPLPPVHGIEQHRQVSEFKRVNVTGQLNVSLHTGYSRPQVILHGDPRDLLFVETKVVNGGLYVILGAGYPHFGNVTVDIRGHYLNAFTYHGAGIVKGTELHTSALDLVIENPGSTILRGDIGLRRLYAKNAGTLEISGVQSSYLQIDLLGRSNVKLSGVTNITSLNVGGQSRLSLYWVKSNELVIRSKDNAFIQLGGIVNRLQVDLWGQAYFNGRYLRADEVFVKTHNLAIADIAAVKIQHALARDRSNIYFYNLPIMKTDFMLKSGAVLDMRDLSPPFIQEYGPLNKP